MGMRNKRQREEMSASDCLEFVCGKIAMNVDEGKTGDMDAGALGQAVLKPER